MQRLGVSTQPLIPPYREISPNSSSGSYSFASDSVPACVKQQYSSTLDNFAAGEPIANPILSRGEESSDIAEPLYIDGSPEFHLPGMPAHDDSQAPDPHDFGDSSIPASTSLGALGLPVSMNNSFRHDTCLPPEVFEDEPFSPSKFPFLPGLGSSSSITPNEGSRTLPRVFSGINPLSRTQSGVAALRRAPSNLSDARILLAEAGIASAEQDLKDVDGVEALPNDIPPVKKLKADIKADESSQSGARGTWLSSGLFRNMRPAVGIVVLLLCCLALGGIASSWLPMRYGRRLSADVMQIATPATLEHNLEPHQDLVIVFRHNSVIIEDLHLLCGQTHPGDPRPVASHEIARNCNLSHACTDVFGSSMLGIAGSFTKRELQLLHSCLPGAIDYMEEDHSTRVGVASRTLPAAAPAAKNNTTAEEISTAETNTTAIDKHLAKAPPAPPAASGDNAFDRDPALDLGAAPGPYKQTLGPIQWNLDRISKRDLPLNHEYMYGSATTTGSGKGVTIYVVDSGIDLTLPEFLDPVTGKTRATAGWNVFDRTASAPDCFGHGTALASIAAGKIFGVAKAAKIVGVKVLGCDGRGSIKQSISGLDWVAGHVQKPAVLLLSLGAFENSHSRSLDQAVMAIIRQGVTVIAAAGNSRKSACIVAPANVAEAITVGGTNLASKFNSVTTSTDTESLYAWSNTGPCIDISAPAVQVPSACMLSPEVTNMFKCHKMGNTSYAKTTGTSFAAPQVAGAAAMWLEENPEALPEEVKAAIMRAATKSKLKNSVWPLQGTPDLILYTDLWEVPEVPAVPNIWASVYDSFAADTVVGPGGFPPLPSPRPYDTKLAADGAVSASGGMNRG